MWLESLHKHVLISCLSHRIPLGAGLVLFVVFVSIFSLNVILQVEIPLMATLFRYCGGVDLVSISLVRY